VALVDMVHGLAIIGQSLKKIRDEKLYLEKGYNNFESYAETERHISKGRASNLISFSDVLLNLESSLNRELLDFPISEYALRPLARLSPEDQRSVFELAVEQAPINPVTGKKKVVESYIKWARNELLPELVPASKPEPDPVTVVDSDPEVIQPEPEPKVIHGHNPRAIRSKIQPDQVEQLAEAAQGFIMLNYSKYFRRGVMLEAQAMAKALFKYIIGDAQRWLQ